MWVSCLFVCMALSTYQRIRVMHRLKPCWNTHISQRHPWSLSSITYLHYILIHYGYQTLFSQRSSSRSFALLLSSGFHFSIFLTKTKNNFFSSPSSRFSASSQFRFGTSAAPRQLPVARCINKTPMNANRIQWHTILTKPILYAIPFRPLKKFLWRWPEQDNHVRQMIDVVLLILWSSSGAKQISVPKQVPDLQDIIRVDRRRLVHWYVPSLQHSKYPPFHPKGCRKLPLAPDIETAGYRPRCHIPRTVPR